MFGPGIAAAAEHPGQHLFRLSESDELWLPPAEGLNLAGWSADRASAALDDTLAAWQRWANLHPYVGPQRDAVVDSLRAIRLLSYEPCGSQVAAPTTWLPEEIGADRNDDCRYAWVRDSSLALAILSVLATRRNACLPRRAGTRVPQDSRPSRRGYSSCAGRCVS